MSNNIKFITICACHISQMIVGLVILVTLSEILRSNIKIVSDRKIFGEFSGATLDRNVSCQELFFEHFSFNKYLGRAVLTSPRHLPNVRAKTHPY